MKNESGQSLLNENLKQHKSFGLYDKDGLFAEFEYDENLKRYQSDYGYLTIQDLIKIEKDNDDERYFIWR